MGTWAWWLAQATAGLAHAVALSCSCNRLYFACNRAVFRLLLPIFCLQLPVLRLLPPWRLAFLESRVASAVSYPAWSAVEISRPKVLVFLRLWWDVSTLEGGVHAIRAVFGRPLQGRFPLALLSPGHSASQR